MSDRKYISKVISNGETYHVKDKEIRDSLGQVNGIATLGSDGKVSPSQLPTDIDTTYQFSQSGNSLQVGVNGGAKDTVYTPTITKSTVGLDNVTNDAQVKRTEMGAASGVATLDDNGKVPASQLPSYVDDVLEYEDRSSFPQTGETGKIYVDKSTNITWRWGGSDYVEISPSLALGETSSTAYAGDKGKALADKLSGIESGAQVHRAPTTAEVKNALGTGSGTVKYLREDGTWATPPNSQYSFVDKDTTLDWGTRSTVATAGDVDIHVTMPSNPNTNTARLQVSDTANKRINTKESTGNYLQFTGGTNKFSVSDGTNTFDVGITPSVSFPVTSVVGQTGEVTVSQIASALTGAGYKLTDTIYSLPAATSNTLGGIKTGYTTDARNYKVSLDSSSNAYVNVPWSDTTYSAGTGISLSGTTFGINSTYQDYISHGNTAYSWGNHANAGYASASSLGNYLPLSGGTMTGTLYATRIEGSGTSDRILFRHIDGQNCYGDYGLYLNYHTGAPIYFMGSTYYITNNGGYYNGTSQYANQLYTARSLWGNSFNGTADVTGGLTVLGQTNQFGRGSGASEINFNTYSLYVGTETTRDATSGLYTSGVAFTSMMKYAGGDNYINSPQAWIGLRLYDFPGSERADLVFATKEGAGASNTGTDIPTERMCISCLGNVGIGTSSPSYKLHVAGDIYATGDIMSQSALTVTSGNDNKIILDNTDSETYWSFISFRDHGSEYGWLGTNGSTDLRWNNNVIIHSGNIGSQYVSHADSAGSVAWDNVSGKPSSMPASDVYSWAKASSKPSYSWSEISDKPTSMPASDVYSWAKASSKPSYSWSEITNKPTIPSAGEINYYSYSATIDPSYGLNVLVKISSSGGSIYLPTLSSCQTYTGTSGSQKFALIVRIACHTGGQNFTLYGYRGTGYSQYPHVRSGSTADRTSGVGFGAGDTDTYMLTYDGSLYEAYRLCYTE